MVTAGDFRKGTTFEMDGNVYNVIDFLHVKPGKGSPFVRAKIKNVINTAKYKLIFLKAFN